MGGLKGAGSQVGDHPRRLPCSGPAPQHPL